MESIHNYLIYLRMQHCRKALEEGVSVLNACTESGFPDYSSFLKTFRRLYGITPTDRTKKILAATPMGHFGDSEKDLVGALLFLLNNEAAGFITGICLPVDGGFSAYSGV